MWSRVLLVAACAVFAAEDTTIAVVPDIGTILAVRVQTFPHEVFRCYLETPAKDIIHLKPTSEEESSKFELLPSTTLSGCQVAIKITGPEDNGLWGVFFESANEEKGSQKYMVTVNSPSKPENEIENGDTPIAVVPDIGTILAVRVETFPHEVFRCYLETPAKDIIHLKPTSEEESSKFELLPSTTMSGCQVAIKITGPEDNGLWGVFFESANEEKGSQKYMVTVNSPSKPENEIENEDTTIAVVPDIGTILAVRVQTFPHEVFRCYLETPAKDIIHLKPTSEEESSKFELLPSTTLSGCQVAIKITGPEDNGLWGVFFESANEEKGSQKYMVTVNSPSKPENEIENGDTTIAVVPDIGTILAVRVETFPHEVFRCYLETPAKDIIHLKPTSEEESSKFELLPSTTLSGCQVAIKITGPEDNGLWGVFFESANEEKGSQRYMVTVNSPSKPENEIENGNYEQRDTPIAVVPDIGTILAVRVETFPHEVFRCYLETPAKDIIHLKPTSEEESSKFELLPSTTMSGCQVAIKITGPEDNGLWGVFFESANKEKGSQKYMVTVNSPSKPENEIENGDTPIAVVPDIGTILAVRVETFPHEVFRCYLETPAKDIIHLKPTSEEESSKFELLPSTTLSGCQVAIKITGPEDNGLWGVFFESANEEKGSQKYMVTVNSPSKPENEIENGDTPIAVVPDIGTILAVRVETFPHEVFRCYLETPAKDIIHLKPTSEEESSKFELLPSTTLSGCQVAIKITGPEDNGLWGVFFESANEEKGSQKYMVTVNSPSKPENEIENGDTPIAVVPDIGTILAVRVETFPHEVFRCYLETPAKDIIHLKPTSEEESSKFELLPSTTLSGCQVAIKITGPEDNGLWGVFFESANEEKGSQKYMVTVNSPSKPENEIENGDTPIAVVPDIGTILAVRVETFPHEVFRCYLETPAKDIIHLKPTSEEESSKFELLPSTTLSGCQVAIKITGPEDNGLWGVFFESANEEKGSQKYMVTVNSPSKPENEIENGDTPIAVVPDIGTILAVRVETFPHEVFRCYLETPAKDIIHLKPTSEEESSKFELLPSTTLSGCQVAIKITGPEDNGLWGVFFESANGEEGSQIYMVTVNSLSKPEDEIENDPTPSEENREIEYVEKQIIHTQIGSVHAITIKKSDFVQTESCHIITPDGTEHTFKERDLPGIKWIENEIDACGVNVKVDENMIGHWILYQRATRHSTGIEKRLPFTIIVEEYVQASPTEVTIAEGNNLYIQLVNPPPSDLQNTCSVRGPTEDISSYVSDVNNIQTCGFIIRNVQVKDTGIWHIVFGTKIVYKAPIEVTVTGDNKPTAVVPDIGTRLAVRVETFPHEVYRCYLVTPAREIIHFKPTNEGESSKFELLPPTTLSGCQVEIKMTGPEDNGFWEVFFESDKGIAGRASYMVTVNGNGTPKPEDEIENDPTPSEENKEIEYEEKQIIYTQIGSVHKITIKKYDFVQTESCHIMTPDGIKHTSKERDLPGIKWIEDEIEACGVEIMVDDNMIGPWILYQRATRHSTGIEKRLPFTIIVEEYVQASPTKVTIAEGNDLHIRLVNPPPSDLQNTCSVRGPTEDISSYVSDVNNIQTCGFIIRNVQTKDNGIWHIVFGTKIVYKAPIEVTVTGDVETIISNLKWTVDKPVDEFVGPANTIYCRVRDPAGRTVFEHFSRCRIVLDRATKNHNGNWLLTVGVEGRITTDKYIITVTVLDADPRPKVITHVEKQRPEVILGCSLPEEYEVSSCKFRDPSGRILLASEGVGEDRYSFHDHTVSLTSNVNSSGCGLRIKDPTTRELGLWRCAMETNDEVIHYGFLTVLCPFALKNESVAVEVITEPTLTAYETQISGQEGEVSMACAIQSEIKYCYFRARNGTIFNINPGMNANGMEYVGAGFEAGECGVKMSLVAADSGTWSCNVGIEDQRGRMEEQRVSINVNVNPTFEVIQKNDNVGALVVRGLLFGGRALEYCRYVRIDGLVFFDGDLWPDYISNSDLHHGVCELYIPTPSILDHHPWTVVARARGQPAEVYAVTSPTLVVPPPPPPISHSFLATRFWILVIMMSITVALLGLMLTPKKNRAWTSKKAAAVRNSFRFRRNRNNNTNANNETSPPAYTA